LGIWVTIVEPGAFRTDFLDPRSLRMTERTIEDYAATAGQTREWARQENRQQPGDPVKAAAAMIKIATVATPPLRLPLGPDSIAAIEEKLASVAAELDQWRGRAQSTSYDHAVLGRRGSRGPLVAGAGGQGSLSDGLPRHPRMQRPYGAGHGTPSPPANT